MVPRSLSIRYLSALFVSSRKTARKKVGLRGTIPSQGHAPSWTRMPIPAQSVIARVMTLIATQALHKILGGQMLVSE